MAGDLGGTRELDGGPKFEAATLPPNLEEGGAGGILGFVDAFEAQLSAILRQSSESFARFPLGTGPTLFGPGLTQNK